ncbi:hypothetical protein JL49_13285 [Pseudoalteromonas luteoviolacea]|nr:hypothetical protein JL49_13285 [Pseudoalteromonas luteoviolacea]
MQRNALKIFKPQKLGSAPNAGGYRTNNPIESGKLNDVFSAISEIDHVSSSFNLAKLYPAVATADSSSLNRAHVFISDQNDDDLVSTLIAESPSLKDSSLFIDMSTMLSSARYHGTTVVTEEASGQSLVLREISRTVAPTTMRRIAHTGMKIGEASLYRTAQVESFGVMTEVNIDVPDLLVENPYYYGQYSYWVSNWQRWETQNIFFNQISRNGTSLMVDLPSSKPLFKGNVFTLYYRSTEDFRWHRFPTPLSLGQGEKVLPKANRVKKAGSNIVITDDGEGRFVDGGYIVATIDYETGVINEVEQLDYNGTVDQNLGIMVVKKEQVSRSVKFNIELPIFDKSSFYIKCKTSTGVDISAACDSAGNITGTNVTSGTLSVNGDVSIEFSLDILPSSVSYDIDELEQITAPSPPNEINYNLLPSGRVPIVHENQLICIQDRKRTSYSALVSGQTLELMIGAKWVDIVDSESKSLYSHTGDNYSYDAETGIVTIKAGISAFKAPFIVTTIKSELAQIDSINGNNVQLLTRLSQTYPVGSTVSSVQRLGNFQSRTSDERTVSAWQNNFEDVGSSASNSINTIQYPIQIENIGAINQRWAVVFSTNEEFTVFGETLGAVHTGAITADCAPINPFVNASYFVIPKGAFGAGLSPGEGFLFTTHAASQPIMLVRSISPGHTSIEHDSSTIAFRGFY